MYRRPPYTMPYSVSIAVKRGCLSATLKKLRGSFQGVEYNNPFQAGKEPPGQLAGKPAWVVEFEGIDPDSVEVRGQVYLMSAYGYAYWFFTWAPGSERERAERLAKETKGVTEVIDKLEIRKR